MNLLARHVILRALLRWTAAVAFCIPLKHRPHARLRALGLAVRWTGTLPPARHVFTHRVWQLSGFCAASGQEVLPGSFVWADLPALEREYSVPSAFSAYVSEGKIREKQEENARILT